MKGRMDDRADDEERQKGREYERRKTLKERGRDREVSSGFFLAPHFSSPSAFQSKLASTDRLRSDVFILLARGAKKVKLLIKGNTGETSQICTSYQQLYRAWGTLKHECVHGCARVCVFSLSNASASTDCRIGWFSGSAFPARANQRAAHYRTAWRLLAEQMAS